MFIRGWRRYRAIDLRVTSITGAAEAATGGYLVALYGVIRRRRFGAIIGCSTGNGIASAATCAAVCTCILIHGAGCLGSCAGAYGACQGGFCDLVIQLVFITGEYAAG